MFYIIIIIDLIAFIIIMVTAVMAIIILENTYAEIFFKNIAKETFRLVNFKPFIFTMVIYLMSFAAIIEEAIFLQEIYITRYNLVIILKAIQVFILTCYIHHNHYFQLLNYLNRGFTLTFVLHL